MSLLIREGMKSDGSVPCQSCHNGDMTRKPPQNCQRKGEQDDKPGYVLNNHLSSTAVASRVQRPT